MNNSVTPFASNINLVLSFNFLSKDLKIRSWREWYKKHKNTVFPLTSTRLPITVAHFLNLQIFTRK